MKNFLEKLAPYLIVGISLAIFVAVVIVLSYVLVWGLLIGLILYAIVYIKQHLFPNKKPTSTSQGRIIDQDDYKVHDDDQ